MYASTSAAAAAVPVASLTNWSLASNTDRVEVTAFGDVNKTYVQGLPDVSGDFSGFWNNADTTLRAASLSATGSNVYLYPTTDVATSYLYGPAWIDISYDVAVGDAVKISGSFAANGPWGSLGL